MKQWMIGIVIGLRAFPAMAYEPLVNSFAFPPIPSKMNASKDIFRALAQKGQDSAGEVRGGRRTWRWPPNKPNPCGKEPEP